MAAWLSDWCGRFAPIAKGSFMSQALRCESTGLSRFCAATQPVYRAQWAANSVVNRGIEGALAFANLVLI